jgi:hypothetical protein
VQRCDLRLPEPWLSLFSLDHAVNWEAISAIGQIVGALAVVISLIYLATEVRSSVRATREASMRWGRTAILGGFIKSQGIRI